MRTPGAVIRKPTNYGSYFGFVWQRFEEDLLRRLLGSDPVEGSEVAELQTEALDAVEAARIRLDEVRALKPE